MSKFIVTSESTPMYNYYGKYIGESDKRALCYSKFIGKHRTYRELFELTKEFEYQVFETHALAQEAADQVNEMYSDDFKVELYART